MKLKAYNWSQCQKVNAANFISEKENGVCVRIVFAVKNLLIY